MKKMTLLMTVLTLLSGTVGHAQNNSMGKGAKASQTTSNDWAWGVGLGTLAVVGAIVGLSVAAGTSSQSTSH